MVPLTNALSSGVANAIVGALVRAIATGTASLAAWALGGLTHAAVASTEVRLDTWFQGPWRAMLAVGALAALPLFFVGVLSVLAHGEGPGGLGRLLGRTLAAGVGSLVALAGVRLVLSLVDVAAVLVEHGSGVSLAAAMARLGSALGVATLAGGPTAAAVGAAVLSLVAAAAAFVLWLELAVRAALVVLATAFLPLGLAGLLWPATAPWLRRLGEVIAAVAVSKLVVVVVLVLGAAALTAPPASATKPGADLDAAVLGVAFLALGPLGLPMALRVV